MTDARTEPPAKITGFQKEIADIQTAIADFEMGKKLNVAIISEPFSGKSALINEIEKNITQKVTRFNFSSFVQDISEITQIMDSKRIVILDHCEFMYTRRIGGFDVLKDFLKLTVSRNNIFITTWNLYSWNYLEKVLNIGKFFPVQIRLPKMNTDELKEFILSRYDRDEIKFIEDVAFEKEKLIEFVKYPVTLKSLKKTINIPFFKINKIVLEMKLSNNEEKVTVEDLVFDKIHHISNGNLGAANMLWQNGLEYPAIRPSRIKDFSLNIDLDLNEAFILGIILSVKSIKKDDFVDIAGHEIDIDEILFRLVGQGLININEGYYTLKPEALLSVVEYLKKSRMVW